MPTERQPRGPRLEKLGDLERLVIKVGSAVIAGKGRLRPRIIADLAHDVTVAVLHGDIPAVGGPLVEGLGEKVVAHGAGFGARGHFGSKPARIGGLDGSALERARVRC